jgi:hypothetical protein
MNPHDAPSLPILTALNIHPMPRRLGLMVLRSELQEALDELGIVYGILPEGSLILALEVESALAAAGVRADLVRERIETLLAKVEPSRELTGEELGALAEQMINALTKGKKGTLREKIVKGFYGGRPPSA